MTGNEDMGKVNSNGILQVHRALPCYHKHTVLQKEQVQDVMSIPSFKALAFDHLHHGACM